MARIIAAMGVSLRRNLIEEHLSVRKCPISEREHHDWGAFQDSNGCQIEFSIINWWLSIVICKEQSFNDVHVNDSDQCREEKHRKEHAIHETYVNLHHY